MKKKIPVQEPPVTSYMFYMYPLSIMCPHVAFTPWICSNYIQLYHYNDRDLKFYVSPFSPKGGKKNSYYVACPFLEIQNLEQSMITRTRDDIIQFVIASLDEDWHVQLDVDYFYLPSTAPYRKFHFLHEVLVSGYDDNNETFDISGYDRSWKYHVATITFSDLFEAVSAVDKTLNDNAYPVDQSDESPKVILYRSDNDKEYEIDIGQMYESLSDYLESVNTAEKYRMLWVPQEKGLWGVSVYSYLTESLDQGRNLETLTIPLRVLWEHKKVMAERIRYLEGQGYIDPDNRIFEEYAETTRMANHARWLLLKCVRKPKASLVRKASDTLSDIVEREYRILSNLRKLFEDCSSAPGKGSTDYFPFCDMRRSPNYASCNDPITARSSESPAEHTATLTQPTHNVNFGVDSLEHYRERSLRQLVRRDVYQPSCEDLSDCAKQILRYTQCGRVKVLMPLRELQGDGAVIVSEILQVLREHVGVANIFVVDNGIHPRTVREIVDSRVTVINESMIRQRLDWDRLMRLLNLPDIQCGKGYAITLGIAYLAINGLMDDDDWLVQCDGDIAEFRQFQLMPHLFYPVIAEPCKSWEYLKTAQIQRNNETVKAGINGLATYFKLAQHASVSHMNQQRLTAQEIYEACIHHIWMLTGQFALRWRHAVNRMIAAGYCDETLASAQHGWRRLAQIVNPNPCMDRTNSKQKEDCMMTRIIQFINALTVFGQSVRTPWSLEMIREFNNGVVPGVDSIVWIPDKNGPLCVDDIEMDRVFPSVQTMLDNDLLS